MTWEFQAVLAEVVKTNAIDMVLHGHRPIEADKSLPVRCSVCKTEENILDRLKEKKKNARAKKSSTSMKGKNTVDYHSGKSSRTQISMCANVLFPLVLFVCHLVKESLNKRLIFDLPQFQGMKCFEIGHSLQNSGMFKCRPDAKQKIGLSTSHPVWIKLREMYGLANKKRVC